MEKKVYKLKIDEKLARVMPPLQDPELGLLTASLLAEGCREPLVAWNGVIVDGHNRYHICREKVKIPFTYATALAEIYERGVNGPLEKTA